MTRTNDMTTWPSIRCERGCAEHYTRTVDVDLAREHGYRDLAQVPAELAVKFTMQIWDTDRQPVDGGPYCPARDAVSETILSHGIWEPRETILALSVLAGARADQWFVDLGCQIGWYSLLALELGVATFAIDADPANVALLEWSADHNDYGSLDIGVSRIDETTPAWDPTPIRLAKLDLEGAERDGLRILGPSIEAGLVDHLLVEVSPVFKRESDPDYYPDLVAGLFEAGYEAYMLPPKAVLPFPFVGAEQFLRPQELFWHQIRDIVPTWHQEDLWFRRIGAGW